ncbi:MAG: formylglycine-generating enzyme family protein [Muribaculaceae bacterium]|nr:formylglycine-generating enzyme family protein [Muribaculaceae bacterium]
MFISARLVNVESGVIIATGEELVTDPTSARLMKAAESVAAGIIGHGGTTASVSSSTSVPSFGRTSPVNNTANRNVETFTVNGVTFEMVRVDGGSYQMGSYSGEGDEQPVHTETVNTFYIGKIEVTQRLWSAVMGNNPSNFRGENLPVENVSWYDCQEFVDRLSRLTGRVFRLPTEAEWEYAARGGNRTRGYTYSGSEDVYRVAWYTANSGNATHPVGQKLDNELGIFDMSGNVWEWCSDNYSSSYSQPRNSSNRVFRGGGWDDSASDCRVAYRNGYSPGNRYYDLGLRLAL